MDFFQQQDNARRHTKWLLVYFIMAVAAMPFTGCQSSPNQEDGSFDNLRQRGSVAHKPSGDFGTFLVQQVSHFGGHSLTTNTVPSLDGKWYVESDKEGFGVMLYNVPTTRVQSFLQQVYGPPLDVVTNVEGQPFGWYGARQIGVALQFIGETNGVGFICVKGQQ